MSIQQEKSQHSVHKLSLLHSIHNNYRPSSMITTTTTTPYHLLPGHGRQSPPPQQQKQQRIRNMVFVTTRNIRNNDAVRTRRSFGISSSSSLNQCHSAGSWEWKDLQQTRRSDDDIYHYYHNNNYNNHYNYNHNDNNNDDLRMNVMNIPLRCQCQSHSLLEHFFMTDIIPILRNRRQRIQYMIQLGILLLLLLLSHSSKGIFGYIITTTTTTATTRTTVYNTIPTHHPLLQHSLIPRRHNTLRYQSSSSSSSSWVGFRFHMTHQSTTPSLIRRRRQCMILSLSSSSLSSNPEEPPQHSSSSSLSSEYIYAQRLQHQIDLLRQKDRSSQPIAVPDLQIIYEDNDIIVVDKPAGILCLPSEDGVPSIVATVFEYIQQQQHERTMAAEAISNETATTTELTTNDKSVTNTTTTKIMDYDPMSGSERVHAMDQMIVHRLGYDTAGLLVLAKTIPAVRALNILFRTRPTLQQLPSLPTTRLSSSTTSIQSENITNTTTTTATTTESSIRNSDDDNDIQNYVVTDNIDDTIADIGITERLNQMGIIRQYEVLVAGHVHPQFKAGTISTETTQPTTSNSSRTDTEGMIQPPSPLGSGWIHLPLMRCYEYPPYMRVSTPEQQQYLLSLDSTIVGKKLLEAPKASLTYYEIMSYEYYQDNTSLPVTRMTLTSMTGRTHQLNVHCAAIGHPIVRDTVYGYNGSAAPYGGLPMDQLPDDSASIELQRAIHEMSISSTMTTSTMTTNTTSATKMCVHAKVIRFKHPITGVDLEFTSTPLF